MNLGSIILITIIAGFFIWIRERKSGQALNMKVDTMFNLYVLFIAIIFLLIVANFIIGFFNEG